MQGNYSFKQTYQKEQKKRTGCIFVYYIAPISTAFSMIPKQNNWIKGGVKEMLNLFKNNTGNFMIGCF